MIRVQRGIACHLSACRLPALSSTSGGKVSFESHVYANLLNAQARYAWLAGRAAACRATCIVRTALYVKVLQNI